MIPGGHEDVERQCIEILRAAFPYDEYAYLYLGNWFTDVSQALAPVDYAAGMIAVFREGMVAAHEAHGFLGDTFLARNRVQAFVRDMFGPSARDSGLATWFRNVIYVMGWLKFCSRRQAAARPVAEHTAGYELIPFEEYDRLFSLRFSQYFPHEHLDRWPMDRDTISSTGRRIYQYLEHDLQYVSELLTRVDRDWVRQVLEPPPTRATAHEPSAAQQRHTMLVEFGHALHAVEDFFAHSNFVEHAYKQLAQQPVNPVELLTFQRRLLREQPPRSSSEIFGPDGRPLPSHEHPVEETNVVTGYFDSVDTSYSLDNMFQEFENRFADANSSVQTANGQEARTLLDYTRAKTPEEREGIRRRYQLVQDALEMPEPVKVAQRAYMDRDWQLMDAYSGTGASTILQRLRHRVAEYQNGPQFPDGTTARQRLGCHSLLAKDDDTEKPYYDEAKHLAIRVSRYVCETMVANVNRVIQVARAGNASVSAVPPNGVPWVDWLELLRYFCGHPAEAPNLAGAGSPAEYWWTHALSDFTHGVTGHVPQYITVPEARHRANVPTRYELEQEHNDRIDAEVGEYANRVQHTGQRIEEPNESVGPDEVRSYEHRGVNQGTAWIRCRSGEIRVTASAELPNSSIVLSESTLEADQLWVAEFRDPRLTGDRTHRTTVRGTSLIAPSSSYEILMISYRIS